MRQVKQMGMLTNKNKREDMDNEITDIIHLLNIVYLWLTFVFINL